MNTVQLTNDMMRNKAIKKYFKGVFPSDKLPNKFKKPALLIANLDPSTRKGSHWVAIFIPKSGKAEYFDSVGRGPEQQSFLQFLNKHSKTYVRNKKRLQGSLSTTCGNYCGVYLFYKAKRMPFQEFLNLFSSTNYKRNDEKIMEIYRKIFKTTKKVQVGGNNQIICNQTCQPCGL